MNEEEISLPPVIAPGQSFASVTDTIASIVLSHGIRRGWMIGVGISLFLLTVLGGSVFYLIGWGVGIWGVNIPVAWGFAIANFVWWIGIGHAGTFISAFLLLLRQEWRTSINRFAEAMTLFAVMCAGMFPLLHLGRPWFFYWLFPYPNSMGVWPQFRSPLMWDVFAVSTYFTVSLIFWYVGMLPDFATLRDHAQSKPARLTYGVLSMGWCGSAKDWKQYQMAYLLLGGLATPLVVSVHTVVSFDFTIAQLPGWHSTIFPPYFVAGAIFSGFAMVMTLAIPLRKFYKLESLVTLRHFDNMAKLTLVTGWIVAYGYAMEAFMAFYSGDPFEKFVLLNRLQGPYWFIFWSVLFSNVAVPQLLWLRSIRRNLLALFLISLVIQYGMWAERVMIVITSLHRDFLPSSWGIYYPTVWDIAVLLGSIGLFLFLFLLFIRLLPMISMSEVRELVAKKASSKEAA